MEGSGGSPKEPWYTYLYRWPRKRWWLLTILVAVAVFLLKWLALDDSVTESVIFAAAVGTIWAVWGYVSLQRDGLN